MRRTLIAAFLACLAPAALAWGVEGHQLIARIAETQLTPTARLEIQKLIAQEPGATLVSISTWADEHRNPATAPWHYVNFPRGNCHYQPDRDCPDGKCVIAAINRQAEVMRTASDPGKRLTALKYLVHLVGDIHQPLHAGWGDDRGGNSYQIQAFMRGSNLHAFWDTGMIQYFNETQPEWNKLMSSLVTQPTARTWSAEDVAEESCRIVAGDDFYPQRHAGAAYAEHFKTTLTQRLTIAGNRLAQLLNGMWP